MSEIKKYNRERSYCFTSFNIANYDTWKTNLDLEKEKIQYMVYQMEECPETKKKHIQGYVEFRQQVAIKGAKKRLQDNKIHLEPRRGTKRQAREYCMKKESQIKEPIELGTFRDRGTRTDISKLYEMLKNGGTPNDVMEEYPAEYTKYFKAVDRMYNNINSKKEGSYRNVDVKVLYGDAGSGKTRYVYEKEGIQNVYRLTRANNNSIWFDGYTNQKVLLIDDYYGWIQYGQLLELLDGYVMRLQQKGSHAYSLWDKVYITSNKHPEEWYTRGLTPALSRRIKEITECLIDEKEVRKPIENSMNLNDLRADEKSLTLGIVLPQQLIERKCGIDGTSKGHTLDDRQGMVSDISKVLDVKNDNDESDSKERCKRSDKYRRLINREELEEREGIKKERNKKNNKQITLLDMWNN